MRVVIFKGVRLRFPLASQLAPSTGYRLSTILETQGTRPCFTPLPHRRRLCSDKRRRSPGEGSGQINTRQTSQAFPYKHVSCLRPFVKPARHFLTSKAFCFYYFIRNASMGERDVLFKRQMQVVKYARSFVFKDWEGQVQPEGGRKSTTHGQVEAICGGTGQGSHCVMSHVSTLRTGTSFPHLCLHLRKWWTFLTGETVVLLYIEQEGTHCVAFYEPVSPPPPTLVPLPLAAPPFSAE